MKKPPYANLARQKLQALAKDRAGIIDAPVIYTGRNAWKITKQWIEPIPFPGLPDCVYESVVPATCLPNGDDPASIKWESIFGQLSGRCRPYIWDTGETPEVVIQELALVLLDRIGVFEVVAEYQGGREPDIFEQEKKAKVTHGQN